VAGGRRISRVIAFVSYALAWRETSSALGFSPIKLRPETCFDRWHHFPGVRKASQTSFVKNDFSIDGDLEDSLHPRTQFDSL